MPEYLPRHKRMTIIPRSSTWVPTKSGCQCVSDTGSGLNFKRKRFLALMERVAKREVTKIVVAHKDRLCRFGARLCGMVLQS